MFGLFKKSKGGVMQGQPHGYMPFEWKGKKYKIWGGPYVSRPDGMVGIKMAREINLPCTVDVPTEDFSVPPVGALMRGVAKALVEVEMGETLYVGCMGGTGRTGLFMAALAKYTGEKDPIKYVRKHYKAHAVETSLQEEYIMEAIDKEFEWMPKHLDRFRNDLSVMRRVKGFFKGLL